MTRMTEEEADALDEVAENYILTRAEATHQTPSQIIGKMVRKELAISA
ncbi:MAG: hypothetical protein LBS64_00845 [Spirochaetaceae bacterium]|nr:hypothetical protein [Spirochaetaceae bacterium]